MRNLFKKHDIFASALCLCLIVQLGCAEKTRHSVENKIKTLSDTELVSYYKRIEEKIRTVDAKMQDDEHLNANSKRPDPNVNLMPTPFWIGGEGYDLLQQRKTVLKEMEKRNITP